MSLLCDCVSLLFLEATHDVSLSWIKSLLVSIHRLVSN